MEDLLIGTSGYDYPEWKGVFYPEDLKRNDFLQYYTTQFNALELNNTFYNMPSVQRMENFISKSDGKLQFSVKANKLLTHEISSEWKLSAEEFKNAVKPMNEKGVLGAVLFQFPQSFHYLPDNRYYLAHIIEQFDGFPVVIEFRHMSWIRDSVFEGLSRRNASVVFCDLPQISALPFVDYENSSFGKFPGNQAYIRLHGRNAQAWYASDDSSNGSSRYDYEYSQEELKKFVPVVKLIKNANKKTQIFFNNHPKGSGAKNALALKEMLCQI